jgi:predicted Zn-dependent protease
MASSITNEYKVLQNKEVSTFINKVGKSTALFSGRADIEYFFGILDTDDIISYGTPGGYVFISKGMLKLIRNEAELSAVLAHEIAHINRKHVLGYLSKYDYKPEMENTDNYRELVKSSLERISALGFSLDEELEADFDAAAILNETGYFPGGYAEFIEYLSNQESSKSKIYQTSHQHLSGRLVKIKKHIKDEAYDLNKPKNAERYKKSIASLK